MWAQILSRFRLFRDHDVIDLVHCNPQMPISNQEKWSDKTPTKCVQYKKCDSLSDFKANRGPFEHMSNFVLKLSFFRVASTILICRFCRHFFYFLSKETLKNENSLHILFQELVHRGIPHHFRAMAWQLLCGSHDSRDKEKYSDYMKSQSACEKVWTLKKCLSFNLELLLHSERFILKTNEMS